MSSFLLFALLLLVINRAREDVRAFSFVFVLISVWAHTLFFALSRFSTNPEYAIPLFKICIISSGTFLMSSLMHFVHILTNIHRKRRWILYIFDFVNLTFAFAAIDPLYASFAPINNWGFWPTASPLLMFYLASWFVQVTYCLSTLYIKGVKENQGSERKAYKQMMLGMAIGFTGGSTTWLLWYNIACPPHLNFTIALFAIWTGYAVFKHQLFDIEIIIKKTAIFSGLCTLAGIIIFTISYLFTPLFEELGLPEVYTTFLSFVVFISLFKRTETLLENVTNKWLSQKKINYERLLNSLGETLKKISELDPLCNTLSRIMIEVLNIQYFMLYVYDVDEDCYTLKTDDPVHTEFPLMYDTKDSIVRFISKNDAILSQDFTANAHLQKLLTEMKARVLVPLKSAHRLIGFAIMGNKLSDKIYNNMDLKAFKTMQTSVATSIENALALEQLKQSQYELAQKEKLATVGVLAAGIKHEINNPLFVILGRSEMILRHSALRKKETWDREKMVNYVEKQLNSIKFNADRIKDIVARLSDFSKPIDAADMQSIVVTKSVYDAIKLLGYDDAHMADINFDIVVDPELKVIGDSRMLVQIFFNLINNAIHAMNFSGTISVDSYINKRAHISISDTGVGIEEKFLKRIFDPFFTTKDSTQGDSDSIKGTGLGLHLVYNYVKKMNGDITVESTPEIGTHFTIILNTPPKMEGQDSNAKLVSANDEMQE